MSTNCLSKGFNPTMTAAGAAAVLLLLFFAVSAKAVMPPAHYTRLAEESNIKAVAVVMSVDVIKQTKRSTLKRILFELKNPLDGTVPKTFTGTCYSVDHDWQKPQAGGTIYYYPVSGTTVYVTVQNDGGAITSYTVLTRDMEKSFTENPGKIRFKMGKAYLEK